LKTKKTTDCSSHPDSSTNDPTFTANKNINENDNKISTD